MSESYKIDALLVYISTVYVNLNYDAVSYQLGQFYIAEYAHNKGYNIRIKNFTSNDPLIDSISNLLKELNCKVLGFYVDSENIWTIRKIIYDIKLNVPGTIVFLGGPQLTGDPEKTLRRIEDADFGIIGEGEITVTELLDSNFSYNDVDNPILGVCYISDDNKFISTGFRKQTSNLDVYPYPIREHYALDADLKFNSILTGRGCIGRCAFCFEGSKVNNILRLRSIENVCEEISYIVGNLPNNTYLTFLDDTFILNPQRTEAICNWLIEKYGGKVKWYCEARVDILIKNIHLLPLMKRAGLIRIQLGGESGSQDILNAYNKGMNISDLKKVVKSIYDCGILSVYINFIIGGAFENLESFNKTLELAIELLNIAPGCAEIGGSLLVPYAGSPIYDHPEKYGLKLLDKETITGSDSESVFVETNELSSTKILQIKDIFDKSISEEISNIVNNLPYDFLRHHYYACKNYGMKSMYFTVLDEIFTVHNYFDAIYKDNFCSIQDLTLETIYDAVPYRTGNIISNGENFFRLVLNNQYIEDKDLEKAIVLLSSGKISFGEILFVLKSKYPTLEDLESKVFNFYKQLDKQFWIVWKTKF